MLSKKGFAAVFKYIFVGIVGAVILVFFINLSKQQFTLGSYKSATEIAATMDDAFEAFSTAPEQADKALDFGANLKFYVNKNANVNDNFCNQISVDQGQTVKHSKVIFAPLVLSTRSINIWTKTWLFPFKAGSFFYISSPKIKYHLVYGDRSLVDTIYSEIPRRFNFERNELSSVRSVANAEASKFDKIKFVFFNAEPNIQPNDKIDVLKIEFQDPENKHGVLKFNSDSSQPFFIGREMLYGAIFAGSRQSYECARNAALKRLNFVAKVYSRKAQNLPNNGNCNIYSTINMNLDALTNPITQSIYTDINSLIIANREASGSGECVAVF
ncbi:hypothetical protein HYX19_04690 [Candidatus Woesearchaeota archaeon]|nr:hypothetical protein [Candidatus Woesearchaeota archaeon]